MRDLIFNFKFKVLNPDEQIINTFHRIVLEDFKNWYPERSIETQDMIYINNYTAEDSLGFRYDSVEYNITPCMNVIKLNPDKPSVRCREVCKRMIDFIQSKFPDSRLVGDVVESSISGIRTKSKSSISIEGYEHNKLIDKVLDFELTKIIMLNSINTMLVKKGLPNVDIHNDLSILGRIVFTDGFLNSIDYSTLTDEQSFHNFCLLEENIRERGGSFKFSYKYPNPHFQAVFYPSPLVEEIINNDIIKELPNLDKINEFDESDEKLLRIKEDTFYRFISCFVTDEDPKTYVLKKIFKSNSEFFRRLFEASKTRFSFVFNGISYTLKETYHKFNLVKNEQLKIMNRIRESIGDTKYFEMLYYSTFFLNRIVCRRKIRIEKFDYTSDDLQDHFVYRKGMYYSSSYNCRLLSIGLTSTMIGDGQCKVLDYPAWENFIPKKE
jgi:hypothetical protein